MDLKYITYAFFIIRLHIHSEGLELNESVHSNHNTLINHTLSISTLSPSTTPQHPPTSYPTASPTDAAIALCFRGIDKYMFVYRVSVCNQLGS